MSFAYFAYFAHMLSELSWTPLDSVWVYWGLWRREHWIGHAQQRVEGCSWFGSLAQPSHPAWTIRTLALKYPRETHVDCVELIPKRWLFSNAEDRSWPPCPTVATLGDSRCSKDEYGRTKPCWAIFRAVVSQRDLWLHIGLAFVSHSLKSTLGAASIPMDFRDPLFLARSRPCGPPLRTSHWIPMDIWWSDGHLMDIWWTSVHSSTDRRKLHEVFKLRNLRRSYVWSTARFEFVQGSLLISHIHNGKLDNNLLFHAVSFVF